MTVLVVDDDALIAMSTAAMVEDLGHNVLEAYSGAEALKLLAGEFLAGETIVVDKDGDGGKLKFEKQVPVAA